MDEPRAALLTARMAGLEADIAERRRLVHRYRSELADVPGITVPYEDDEVDVSSCYVMPVVLEDHELRDPLRAFMLEERKVQTSVLYPALHELTAYTDRASELPRSEFVGRAEITLPLFPTLGEAEQDRVLSAFADGIHSLARAGAATGG
jgi:dTDP-4-amino-4,6-dideoxygalactose transaminase